MTDDHRKALDAEIKCLLQLGIEQVAPAEFIGRYRKAGFRFDRSCDIRQMGRYISGDRAGELSPELTLYPVHIATGLSAFHVDLPAEARTAFKGVRNKFFAVSRGYIMSV